MTSSGDTSGGKAGMMVGMSSFDGNFGKGGKGGKGKRVL
jgi:hypothetical protein